MTMHWAVRELMRLVPPPEGGGDVVSWDDIGLPFGLPQDYRQFVAIYGGGTLDDYLVIVSPPAVQAGVLPEMEDVALRPVDLDYLAEYSDNASEMKLVPFAFSGSSDAVYWHRWTADPDLWTTFVRMRAPRFGENAWRRYEFGAVEFLLRWARSEIENPFGDSDVPSSSPFFESWREWR